VDWDLRLAERLRAQNDPDAREVLRALARLRGNAGEVANADAGRRAALLHDCDAAVRELFGALGLPPPREGHLPLYEDATAPACAVLPDGPETRALTGELAGFVALTRRLARPRSEQATMRHFFEQFYGRAQAVPLLRFYEDFSREHFKSHLAIRRDYEEGRGVPEGYDLMNPFGLPLVDAVRAGRQRIAELLRARMGQDPAAEEVSVDAAELEEALKDVPPLPPDCASVTVFAEWVPGEGEAQARLVVSRAGYTEGYGKFLSRFLYLFPERVSDEVRAGNLRLTDDCLAEICGDANFNANLHPPLLRWEISYPTGESGRADQQIPAGDIRVTRSPSDPDALCLMHAATGARIIPIDLGFLARAARPALYQLLSRFSPCAEYHAWIPGPAPEAGAGGEPRIERRPRITLNGRLVLARASWHVPSQRLPARAPAEPARDYFLRVNAWRIEYGLPPQAYVRVHPQFSGPTGDRGAGEPPPRPRAVQYDRAFRNLYKPQFMDFVSPLLVELLGRLATEMDAFDAVFEERYPALRHLPRAEGQAHAAELVLQMDFPAPPGAAA
jgi:hypothetical protein